MPHIDRDVRAGQHLGPLRDRGDRTIEEAGQRPAPEATPRFLDLAGLDPVVQRAVLVAAAFVERGRGAVQGVPAIGSRAAQLRAQEVAEQPVIPVAGAVERLREHVAPRQIREELRGIGAARDLVARVGFEIVEHRGREHEPEDVDGQCADDLGVQVLRELRRLAAQTAERGAPVASEHTAQRDRRDQAFGAFHQQCPLRGVARDPERGEHVGGLFVVAAQVRRS